MAGEQTYIVRPGETLTAIARKLRTSVSQLVRLNAIAAPDRIKAGAALRVPAAAPARPAPLPSGPARELGSLSAKYETGGRGPGTVSAGRGDPGGVSYGSYQLASRYDQPRQFLLAEGAAFAGHFAGLAQGSADFSAAWQRCAVQEPLAFAQAQHAYIKRTHFDPQCRVIRKEAALDVLARSAALGDVVWSTAVQHGPLTRLITAVIGRLALIPTSDDHDRHLIEAIYGERARRRPDGRLVHFASSSPAIQNGVARRLQAECADALAMLASETPG